MAKSYVHINRTKMIEFKTPTEVSSMGFLAQHLFPFSVNENSTSLEHCPSLSHTLGPSIKV